MRRSIVVGLYFVAAVGFAVFHYFNDPAARFSEVATQYPIVFPTARIVGTAVGVLLIAGILPGLLLLFPSIRRRQDRRDLALAMWGILAVVLAVLQEIGSRADFEAKVEADLSDFAKIKPEFVRGVRTQCVSTQKQSALNRQVGITDQQIGAYCDCYASKIADAATVGELRYAARNGQYPQTLLDKIAQYGTACSQAALIRR